METYIIYGVISLCLIFIITVIYLMYTDSIETNKNIHQYAFYNKGSKKIIYHVSNPFYKDLKQIYMSDSIKNDFIFNINNFIKTNNTPSSLRVILSGKEGIGKTTFIEGIATKFNYSLIHFPKNNYSEEMIHKFFNERTTKSIIVFDTIDYDTIINTNKHLYDLLGEMVTKNTGNNIYIFTFTEINQIPYSLTTNFHIHYHYHMDANINYTMNMIIDNLQLYTNEELNIDKVQDIKNKFLRINHKITPGYIIPYLLFNEDFEKSLARFFQIIQK